MAVVELEVAGRPADGQGGDDIADGADRDGDDADPAGDPGHLVRHARLADLAQFGGEIGEVVGAVRGVGEQGLADRGIACGIATADAGGSSVASRPPTLSR
ncbi:hypothetical protein NJ76_10205 [Rhodococcus sp. IITR03]|nr:hypothetical protein NJ76_10205 [Rhodococcus sp. IITR03]